MTVESFRGYVASLVAAIAVIGGALGAAWAWSTASSSGFTGDLAIILSVFTSIIGAGSTFLFMSDAGSRAAHASERATAAAAGPPIVNVANVPPTVPPADPPADG